MALLVLTTLPYAPAANGLTLSVWDNSAWAGTPVSTHVVSNFDVQVPLDSIPPHDTAMTIELAGTLTFPAEAERCFETDAGCFTFNCTFGASTYAFVWFDDHLVCQHGAYMTQPNSFDGSTGNPLRALTKKAITVRARAFVSLADVDLAAQIHADAQRELLESNTFTLGPEPAFALGCNGSWSNDTDSMGGDYKEVKNVVTREACCALCVADARCAGVVWNGPTGPYHDNGCNMKTNLAHTKARTGQFLCRVRPDSPSPAPGPPPGPRPTHLNLSVHWSMGFKSTDFVPVDTALLSPFLEAPEIERVALQNKIMDGWGAWANSVLDVVLLPEAARLTVGICQISTGKCITSTRPSDTDTMRVAEHAYDKSYVRSFVTFQGANISVEYASGVPSSDSSELEIALTPLNCDAPFNGSTIDCEDFAAVFAGDFAWSRVGTVKIDRGNGIAYQAAGLRSVTLYATSERLSNHPYAITLGKSGGGISSKQGTSPKWSVIQANMAAAQKTTQAKHEKYSDLAEVASAVQSAVMWCLLYVPVELGPFAPVSRSWAFLTPKRIAKGDEWIYVIFDWDNLFASYLFALDAKELAYSNLIQVVKSKTAQGFIANFASAGEKSLDRTEPMIGAKVLLEIYKKWGDKWIVDLLLDDLIDWHNWFHTYRRLPPKDLICLGSNPVDGDTYYSPNCLKSARLESGLDNSPMWDDCTFNNVTHQMQLYELSQSSFYVAEAEHLITLAKIIGRPASLTADLAARASAMRTLISEELWDEEGEIFTNKYPNGSFYRRISPTSFYPLMANASTDVQAETMVSKWLMNRTRFCISETYDTTNLPECYWGLPSISMDDPSFPPLGYWRGFVWGPMAQLTYWSLQEYDHIPAVRTARKALTKQMTAMFLDQWRRHVSHHLSSVAHARLRISSRSPSRPPFRDEYTNAGTYL